MEKVKGASPCRSNQGLFFAQTPAPANNRPTDQGSRARSLLVITPLMPVYNWTVSCEEMHTHERTHERTHTQTWQQLVIPLLIRVECELHCKFTSPRAVPHPIRGSASGLLSFYYLHLHVHLFFCSSLCCHTEHKHQYISTRKRCSPLIAAELQLNPACFSKGLYLD